MKTKTVGFFTKLDKKTAKIIRERRKGLGMTSADLLSRWAILSAEPDAYLIAKRQLSLK